MATYQVPAKRPSKPSTPSEVTLPEELFYRLINQDTIACQRTCGEKSAYYQKGLYGDTCVVVEPGNEIGRERQRDLTPKYVPGSK